MEAAKNVNLAGMMALRTPTCTHIFAPASLGVRPPLDNAAYEANLLRFKGLISGFPMTVKEVMEDEKQSRVIAWVAGGQEWNPAAKDPGLSEAEWGLVREFIFIFSLDESGEKIERIVEFLNSKGTEQMRKAMVRAAHNLEQKS
jgi:hypothetical protein